MSALLFSTDFVPLFTHRIAGPTTGFLRLSGGALKNPERLRLGAGTRPHKGGANLRAVSELDFQRYIREGKYLYSFELLKDMAAQGYSPGDSDCAKLISGLFDCWHLTKAAQVIEIVESCGKQGPLAYSALLRVYARGGKVREARRLYDRMLDRGILADPFTINAVIMSFSQKGEIEDAMFFYKDMLRNGLKPKPITCAYLIEATVWHRGFDEMLKLLGEMSLRGMQPNGLIYLSIAKGLCRRGNPDLGFEFLGRAEDSEFPLQVSHYSAVIRALWDGGNRVRALQFTLEMLDNKRMDLDVSTYRVLISCLCKDGIVDEAIDLLRDMDRTKSGPDHHAYCTAIVGLCKHDRLYDAIDLLAVMVEKGFCPTQPTYICLVEAVGSSGLISEALQLARSLQRMKAISVDTHDYLRKRIYFLVESKEGYWDQ